MYLNQLWLSQCVRMHGKLVVAKIVWFETLMSILKHNNYILCINTQYLCYRDDNWGEPERAPHSRDLHHFFMYVYLSIR